MIKGMQPIKTAPKDGTTILVWNSKDKSYDFARYCIRKWWANGQACKPTHWAPLTLTASPNYQIYQAKLPGHDGSVITFEDLPSSTREAIETSHKGRPFKVESIGANLRDREGYNIKVLTVS